MHADHFREFQFPCHSRHHIHGIRTADTDGDHSQSARVRRMRVRADHHSAGECIILKHNLMDNSRTRFPESDSVFVRNACEEFVHFLVIGVCPKQIARRSDFRLNQMIAVNGGGHRHGFSSGGHELKQCHLSGCILHGYSVWSEFHIALSPLRCFHRFFKIVRVEDLFSQCQRASYQQSGRSHF